jgi:hypothetical protein
MKTTCYKCPNHPTFETVEEFGHHIICEHAKFNLLLFFLLSAAVIGCYALSFNTQNVFWKLLIPVIVVSVGFLICFLTSHLRNKALERDSLEAAKRGSLVSGYGDKLLKIIFWFLPLAALAEEKPIGEKTHVFSQIFGFLASLAITNALAKYYEGYLQEMSVS